MKKRFNTYANIAAALISIALGLCAILFAYHSFKVTLSSKRWISTPTEVTYTYSLQYFSGGRMSNSWFGYVPHFTYSFVATDGKTYTKSGYESPIGIRSEDEKKEYEGTNVMIKDIFYDPQNPNVSDTKRPLPFPFASLIALFLSMVSFLLARMTIVEVWDDYRKKISRS